MGDENGSLIEIKRGVKQGCRMSLTLFNIYREGLMESIKETEGDIKINGKWINNIFYVDDMLLLNDSGKKIDED